MTDTPTFRLRGKPCRVRAQHTGENVAVQEESIVLKVVSEWWPFGAFLAGTTLAYWGGQKRQEFVVDTLVRDHRDLALRIAAIERSNSDAKVEDAEIRTTLKHIEQSIVDLRDEIRALRER